MEPRPVDLPNQLGKKKPLWLWDNLGQGLEGSIKTVGKCCEMTGLTVPGESPHAYPADGRMALVLAGIRGQSLLRCS
jgi:hypothetical protein